MNIDFLAKMIFLVNLAVKNQRTQVDQPLEPEDKIGLSRMEIYFSADFHRKALHFYWKILRE